VLRFRLGKIDDAITQLAKSGATRYRLGICDVRVPVLGCSEDPFIFFCRLKFPLCVRIEVSHLSVGHEREEVAAVRFEQLAGDPQLTGHDGHA
jgi:hypothetical protein